MAPPPKYSNTAPIFLLSYRMDDAAVPKPGKWPVEPQTDVKTSEDRIWVDGCFDFAHHGLHARRPEFRWFQRAYGNQDMLAPCFKPEDWEKSSWLGFIPTKKSWTIKAQP